MDLGIEGSRDSTIVLIEILREISRSRRAIDGKTLVYHDLRISGDDAAELVKRIHHEFGTSFNEFRYERYFPNEPESLNGRVARFFGNTMGRKE